jgi:hypothetical protein
MKRLPALAAVLALFAAGCGSSSSSAPTSESKPTFSVTLLPANETPPITNAESTGTGSATITFDVTKDLSGNVTAATVTFVANVSNFPATTVLTVAHIHEGAFGVGPGAIRITAVGQAGTVALQNGAGTFTAVANNQDPATVQAILNNPAGYYFNIHTSLNPGGVMRGQLVKVQ